MDKLRDTIRYITEKYPHGSELSNARLTKMVYLSDWRQAITSGRQITPVKWFFHNYGPFVWDVYHSIKANPDLFEIEETQNMFGNEKTLIRPRAAFVTTSLTPDEIASIDHVIQETHKLFWKDFIQLVYSTFPVLTSRRHEFLDLVQKAQEYKRVG